MKTYTFTFKEDALEVIQEGLKELPAKKSMTLLLQIQMLKRVQDGEHITNHPVMAQPTKKENK